MFFSKIRMDHLAAWICCGGCPFYRSIYNSQEGCSPVSASPTILPSHPWPALLFLNSMTIVSAYCYNSHVKGEDTISFGRILANSFFLQNLAFVTDPPKFSPGKMLPARLWMQWGRGIGIRHLYYLISFIWWTSITCMHIETCFSNHLYKKAPPVYRGLLFCFL